MLFIAFPSKMRSCAGKSCSKRHSTCLMACAGLAAFLELAHLKEKLPEVDFLINKEALVFL